MKYQTDKDFERDASFAEQKKNSSAFEVVGLEENESDHNAPVSVQDTFVSKPSVVQYKTQKVTRDAQPSLVIKYADLFPDEVYNIENTLTVTGKIQKVDEEIDGVYVMDEKGGATYINFDFMNVTTGKKDFITGYIQVGRKISAVCKEEGRTLVVNSFKIW